METYTVIAKRFTPDGMVADKRVHTELTHSEMTKLFRRYSPKLTNYWSEVRSFRDDRPELEDAPLGEGYGE